jgi:sugar lactone lactonase YvrE
MTERSTLQPFAPGDVFVGSTVLDNPTDDHAGRGRIIQFDSKLRRKGVLWLPDATHLVGGLKFDDQGRLWAFDSQDFLVMCIGRDGRIERRNFGARPFSNVNFAPDGTLYLAEHVAGRGIRPEIQVRMGTSLAKMPGTDRLGDGHVWHFEPDGTLIHEYCTQTHGGRAGFLGVTMSALAPDGATLVYCSETGPRLMRYDLRNDRQLNDLQCFPEGEREMFFGVDYGPQGRLYVSRGSRIDVVDSRGRTTCCYPLEGEGWAILEPSADGRHLYVGNFFTGRIIKLSLECGEEIARADTGVLRSLAGIAEYPGSAARGEERQRRRTPAVKRKAAKRRKPRPARLPRKAKRRKPARPRLGRRAKRRKPALARLRRRAKRRKLVSARLRRRPKRRKPAPARLRGRPKRRKPALARLSRKAKRRRPRSARRRSARHKSARARSRGRRVRSRRRR